MVLKINYTSSIDLTNNTNYFTNHQKWKIGCGLDSKTGLCCFYLQDSFGISYCVTEFIVEDLDPQFSSELNQIHTSDEQQQRIQAYLEQRLRQASPYQVHVESQGEMRFIRFGDYGLKGGGKTKILALAASLTQVGIGIALSSGFFKQGKMIGGILISSGLSSGLLAYNQDENESDYWKEYAKNFGYGVLTSVVSYGTGFLVQGTGLLTKISAKVLGGALQGAASTAAVIFAQEQKLPDLNKVACSAAAGSLGATASLGAGALMDKVMGDNVSGVAAKALRGAVQGAAGSMGSKAITNLFEKKRLSHELLQEGILSGVVNGGIMGLEQITKNRELYAAQYEQSKQKQTESDLKSAQESAAKSRHETERTEQRLQQAEQEFLAHQQKLQELHQTLQAQQQAAEQARQQVQQAQQIVDQASKTTAATHEQLIAAQKRLHAAQQNYQTILKTADDHVKSNLERGFKAKVGGYHLKSPEQIKEAFFRGEKIKWTKRGGQTKTIQVKTSVPQQHQEAQRTVEAAQSQVRKLQSSLEQKQAALTAEQHRLSEQQQKVDQDRQEVHANQGSIEKQQRHVAELKTQFLETQGQLEAALQRQNYLESLFKNQQAAVQAAQNVYQELCKSQAQGEMYPIRQKDRAQLKTLQPEKVSYVDCGMNDLIPHVVLVHGLNCTQWVEGVDLSLSGDDYQLSLIQGIFNSDGTIGHHLQLEKREFKEGLTDRPHIHWSWNQLVQPHGGTVPKPKYSWEGAQIALLEPLLIFENSSNQKPIGVAPYDTITIGSHCPSDKSTLVVPAALFPRVKSYLTGFQGKYIVYDASKQNIRSAVIDALKTYYSQTWHVCDEKGQLIGHEVKHSALGYAPKTYLKTTNGQVVCLIQEDGKESEQQISKSMKEYAASKRFIGLHAHSTTYMLEVGTSGYFPTLKQFTTHPAIVKNHPLFAGTIQSIEALGSMGSLKAFKEFYEQLLIKHDSRTGAQYVADYILNEAMHADLVSLFYQGNPDTEFDLCAFDLRMIFTSSRAYLINLLENIGRSLQLNQKQKAFEFFKLYCSQLQECLLHLQQAKKEALSLSNLNGEENNAIENKEPLCLTVAQSEWEKIEMAASVEFDLGKNWPLNDQFYLYVDKMLRTLPTDAAKLRKLYLQLSSLRLQDVNDQKKQCHLEVVCNIIQWTFQEKVYLTLRKDDLSPVLVDRLSKHENWLADYGLELADFTQYLGDCLFDNVAAQLRDRSSLSSQQLRQNVVKFLHPREQEYASMCRDKENRLQVGDGIEFVSFNSWEEYLRCIAQPLVWATELEVHALAFMLDCPIVLMTFGAKPKIYHSGAKNSPLILHYVNTNHFESCVPFKGLTPLDVYPKIRNEEHY